MSAVLSLFLRHRGGAEPRLMSHKMQINHRCIKLFIIIPVDGFIHAVLPQFNRLSLFVGNPVVRSFPTDIGYY